MTNPLALLPLALAAAGGTIDRFEAQQLVAAGLTLLQRSVPLVRALSGRRSAILVPTSPAFLTALAASDGRGALLVDPRAAPSEIAFQCADADVGAIFTLGALASCVPAGLTTVLLDDAPRSARVIAGGAARDVDLGSHHGLALEGEADADGRDEEAVVVYSPAANGAAVGAVLTHRNLLTSVRSVREADAGVAADHILALLPISQLFALTAGALAPLLSGARVTTMDRFDPAAAARLLADGATGVVGDPALFRALLGEIERQGAPLRSDALRLCICSGGELPLELQARWADATGVELRQGYGMPGAPACLFNRVDRPNGRGTLGLPLAGVEVAILRPADSSVSPSDAGAEAGEPGEICVRGPGVAARSVGRGLADWPRQGGWLRSGDRGVREADDSVRYLGRLQPA